jgi:hypothetical protein
MGIKVSMVDNAGLVNILIATSQQIISTGRIHRKISPGMLKIGKANV